MLKQYHHTDIVIIIGKLKQPSKRKQLQSFGFVVISLQHQRNWHVYNHSGYVVRITDATQNKNVLHNVHTRPQNTRLEQDLFPRHEVLPTSAHISSTTLDVAYGVNIQQANIG